MDFGKFCRMGFCETKQTIRRNPGEGIREFPTEAELERGLPTQGRNCLKYPINPKEKCLFCSMEYFILLCTQ